MSRASICKYVPGGGGKFSAQPCVCVWQGRGNPRSLLFKNRDHRLDVTIDFTCQAFSYLED